MRVSRRSLGTVTVLAAGLGCLLIGTAALSLRDRLPDPIATPFSGDPVSRGLAPVIGAGLWLVFCGIALVVGWTGWERRTVRAWTGAVLGFGAGCTAGVVAATLRANVDKPHWRDADPTGWGVPVLVIAGALLVGAIGWSAGNVGPDGPGRPRPPEQVRRLDLAEGERAVWTGYVHNRWQIWLGAAMAALGTVCALLVLILPEPLTPGRPVAIGLVPPAVVGLVMLTLSSARVTVDSRGLSIAFGPLGRPVRRIALDAIDAAWVEDRGARTVGGFGYQGLPGHSTVLVRQGECLVVSYGREGKEFAVSVDDAERGAALLNSLREAAAAGAGVAEL